MHETEKVCKAEIQEHPAEMQDTFMLAQHVQLARARDYDPTQTRDHQKVQEFYAEQLDGNCLVKETAHVLIKV